MKKIIAYAGLVYMLMGVQARGQSEQTPLPVYPVPSEAQLAWHRMEMNAFIHFTINTFTGREWGLGSESPELFNPESANPSQWAGILKASGFSGVILTCKHHDGFCLWPSRHTTHSIRFSPYQQGKGNLVKELSDACRAAGLKFGVYLSPWDRNHAEYGKPDYIAYYRNQLKELFAEYGPIFEMWFDGANGGSGYYGGANEHRTIDGKNYYDWPATLNLVRSIQPEVIFFSDAGPGVRWVGNESGIAGETNWNMITPDTIYAGKPGINNLLQSGSEDGTCWIPAETDVSIRPGWFYHAEEDSLVKTPEQLFEIYLASVGRGSLLLLNVPPDKRGLIHAKDQTSLKGFSEILKREFENNLALGGKVNASSVWGQGTLCKTEHLADGNPDSYWSAAAEEKSAALEINLDNSRQIKYIVLQEYIRLGQRVRSFTIEALVNGNWKQIAAGTTIGYKRILRVEPLHTGSIRINISDSRACPILAEVSVY